MSLQSFGSFLGLGAPPFLPLPLPQRRLDDLLRHAGVLPFHEIVRREGLGQRLPVDVVDEEVRGEPLLLELDQIGQQSLWGDRRLGGRGGRGGGGPPPAPAPPGAPEAGVVGSGGGGLLGWLAP